MISVVQGKQLTEWHLKDHRGDDSEHEYGQNLQEKCVFIAVKDYYVL